MIIYSKTNTSHGYFIDDIWKPLTESRCQPYSVYSYDSHDYVVRGITIDNCLDDNHWEHLREDPTSKFLIFHPDEYFNYHDVNMWIKCFKEKSVPPNQIYIVVGDENWKKWLTEALNDSGIHGFHICHLPLLLARCRVQKKIPITNRFSLLCRNYQKWRTNFFMHLLKNNLLDSINYTFNNLVPYGDLPIIPHEQILSDIQELGYTVDEKIKSWVYGAPYSLKETKITTKFSNEAYDMITSSGINITIESQIDPYYFFSFWKHMPREKFSVSAFATEKTYKAIACARPFIIVSSPNFLKDLRQLGFKTFHPYIDESYDQEYNINDRFAAITKEITRLNNLSEQEFNELLNKLQPIADHNLVIFNYRKETLKLSSDFDWIANYHNPVHITHVDGISG
jgi:hypothetical protein